MMHYGFGFGGGFLFWIFNGLLTILFLVGLVFFIIFLVRAGRRQAWHEKHPGFSQIPGEMNPKEVLQMRYAKGEIKAEEYKKILADLEK
jgi:uncharacterized membrane protein